MNPWLILAVLLALAGFGSWGTYESGQASKWEGKYNDLQDSYKHAAIRAKADAITQEKRDLAALQNQSSLALQSAQDKANQAQKDLLDYKLKLKKASGEKDLPHVCSGILIPKDLVPK